MEYRNIGTTGMSASIVGLGTEQLDGRPYEEVEDVVHAAMERGVNIMDLFMPGEEIRRNIGRTIAGKRDRWLIQGHLCSVLCDGQYDATRDPAVCRWAFEDLLRCLGTDYIDFGMLYFMDSDEAFEQVFETELIDYVLDLKRQGILRSIGAGSHNPAVARRLVETGVVDLLMFSVNPVFDMMPSGSHIVHMMENASFSFRRAEDLEPARAELYRLCERRGVAITAMKTLGAGKLLSPVHSPFARALSVGQCIHYALTRPAVVSALIGCTGREEVLEATRYSDLSEAERDYSTVVSALPGTFEGMCMYCGHCRPCPAGIDVADTLHCLDVALLDETNVPPALAERYEALPVRASGCDACGECERRCPFGVPVVQKMRQAAQRFGS